MSEIKLCKDCKWFKEDFYSNRQKETHCMRESIEPVYGYKIRVGTLCSHERIYACGQEAKYFEPKGVMKDERD